jgi:predicted porin
MNKRLLAITIAASLAAPLTVMAEGAEIYGIAHVTVDKISVDDGSANAEGWFVTSRNSRLGVKGSEDLGGGLKAVYKMEFGVAMDSGGGLTGRNQYVGLSGGMGTVLLGRHDTPTKMVQGKFDVFNDTIADMATTATHAGVSGDIRADNVIAYLSPKMGGMQMIVALLPGEGNTTLTPACTGTSPCDGISDGVSVSFTYEAGPLYVGAALDSGDIVADNMRLAATYNMDALQVGFLYNTKSDDAGDDTDFTDDEKAMGLSAKFAMGDNAVKAQYISVTDFGGTANADGTNMTFGYDMNMSARTTVYALLNMYSPDVAGGPSEDETALSVGVSHSF